ncbi:hypothetical protein G6F65_020691 [Rhizopus arrhizus]|nr:hypothetical protein G6F65_020691 [Rhizopus arrhizus]
MSEILRELSEIPCMLVRLSGVFGVLLDGGGKLFHRRGGLFQGRGLLFGARRQVGLAGRDLRRAHIDFLAALAHGHHRARQALLHALQRGEQGADLVVGAGFDPGGQVAAGNAVEVPASLLQGLQHAAPNEGPA